MRLARKCLFFFRRVLGTKQILEQQLHHQERQQQEIQCEISSIKRQLISLGNALKYFNTDLKTLKETTTFKRCAEIVSLLSPMNVEGARYVRFGKDYDGGYVMLDNFNSDVVDAAYSFGISGDISWDEDIANRGIDVFMYDHTIEQLPKRHPKFHFFNLGVTGRKKDINLKKLSDLLVQNGHAKCKNLIMKMDIEGCEWDVFEEIEIETMNQFSQIIVEFHGLASAVYDAGAITSILNVLKKINQTHKSVYLHANINSFPLWVGELAISDLMEVTYVRYTDGKYRFNTNTRQFPTELDQPTFQGWPDMYLGKFACDEGAK